METQEVQSVCKYINIYRVDAIVLLVKSNRDLDSFLQLMQRAEQPVPSIIVGALSTQAKTELKRRTMGDVEKYRCFHAR